MTHMPPAQVVVLRDLVDMLQAAAVAADARAGEFNDAIPHQQPGPAMQAAVNAFGVEVGLKNGLLGLGTVILRSLPQRGGLSRPHRTAGKIVHHPASGTIDTLIAHARDEIDQQAAYVVETTQSNLVPVLNATGILLSGRYGHEYILHGLPDTGVVP